jgi:tyrosine-protein phosphatase YwqE
MNTHLQDIREASDSLLYLSESDYPFEVVHWEDRIASINDKVLEAANKPSGTIIEKISLEYFFRNMITSEDQQTAQRFKKLQEILKNKLSDIEVHRVGEIQVDAFIIGRLKDGSYAGLHTKLIET